VVLPRRVRLHPVAGGRVSGIPSISINSRLDLAGAFTDTMRGVEACCQ